MPSLISVSLALTDATSHLIFRIQNLFDATLGRLYNSKNCFIKNVDSNEKFGR